MRWLDGITDAMDMNLGKQTVRDREAWHATVRGVAKNQTRLGDWTIATTSYRKRVQSLKSRECCGLEALVLLIVFDHVPYFNCTKMLVGFSEAIFCGNSGLETMFPCPQMIFCLSWSSGVILRVGRKWLPRSEFDRHLRDSNSQWLFPGMSLCIQSGICMNLLVI